MVTSGPQVSGAMKSLMEMIVYNQILLFPPSMLITIHKLCTITLLITLPTTKATKFQYQWAAILHSVMQE